MNWTETKKQLPKEGKKVLTIITNKKHGYKYYEVGYYKEKTWWNDMIGKIEHKGFDTDDCFFVSHWMYLPDKPE